jgi:hypothetical protein
MLVLNRHTGREHFEYIAQNIQLGIAGECAIAFCPGIIVLAAALHDRRL